MKRTKGWGGVGGVVPLALGLAVGMGGACRPAGDRETPDDQCRVDSTTVRMTRELPAFLFRAGDVAWVSESSLAVTDLDDRQVVIVGSVDGGELRRIGGEGGGAGEFRAIGGVIPTKDGYVVSGYSRVTLFDRVGGERATVSVPGMITGLLTWDGTRARVVWALPGIDGPTVGWATPSDGTWEADFRPFVQDADLDVEFLAGIPNPFVAAAGEADGSLVIGQPSTYRLTRFGRGGAVLRVFGRPELERVARPPAEQRRLAQAMKQRMLEAAPQLESADLGPVDEALSQPRLHFRRLRFDPRGRLWVVTDRNTSHSTDLDVFGADGNLLGTVTLAHRIVDLSFRGDQVAVLRERQFAPADGQFQLVVGAWDGGGCRETVRDDGP